MAEPWFSTLALIARILLATVFLFSGIEKATHYQRTLQEFERESIPLRPASVVFTIALHIIAPLCLIAGWFVSEMAIALAVFTVAATVLVHHFWTMQGDERLARTRIALSNLAVIGGLLLLAAAGPGKWTL